MKNKILIIYYSRTGNTKKIAEELALKLNADIEEIIDLKNRKGMIGWFLGGKDGMKEKITNIKQPIKKCEDYKTIIIGSPIWVGLTPAIRTYLLNNKDNIKDYSVFCTMGGENPNKLFTHVQGILNMQPKATLAVRAIEIKNNNYQTKLNEFMEKMR